MKRHSPFPPSSWGTGAGRRFIEVPAEVGAGSPPRSAGNPASEKLNAAGQAFAVVHFGVRWGESLSDFTAMSRVFGPSSKKDPRKQPRDAASTATSCGGWAS